MCAKKNIYLYMPVHFQAAVNPRTALQKDALNLQMKKAQLQPPQACSFSIPMIAQVLKHHLDNTNIVIIS